MSSELIIIKVTGNLNKFINKCLKYEISLLNITYLDKETALVKIYKEDYSRIKKINYYCKISKYKLLGIDRFIKFIKENLIILFTVIICFVLMSFIQGIIVKIEVIHSNKEIINLVKKELKLNGIHEYQLKKSYKELDDLKNKIIENNPDKLEWMSIKREGMKYTVRVEERIITKIKETDKYCHIVAKKDGIVKKIISSKGEIIPVPNDFVRKGDLLISGQIHLNEEIKDNICANGEVYAETWYKINVIIPLNYLEKKYTKNTRYNFIINNKKVLKDKYEKYDTETLNKIQVKGLNIKYIKELEYIEILKKYKSSEALEKALKEASDKMEYKLNKNEKIISKKVLKNNEFNSKIDVEVFLVVLENIGVKVNYELEGDISATE